MQPIAARRIVLGLVVAIMGMVRVDWCWVGDMVEVGVGIVKI